MDFHDIYPLLVTIQSASILLHVIGIYLLTQIRPSAASCEAAQRPFLYTLSFIDIVQSILGIISDTCNINDEQTVAQYLEYANYGVYVIYVLFMTSLTINRLLEIYLNIRYELYWSKKKSTYLILIIFILGMICGVTMMSLKSADIRIPPDFAYMSICLDSMALLVSVFTNGYILYKIVQIKKEQQAIRKRLKANRKSSRKHLDINNNANRAKQHGNNKAYFLISALVLSTLMFLLAPDLLVNLMSLGFVPLSLKFYYISLLFYAVGLLTDALIYILLYPPVQRIFLKKFQCINREDSRRNSYTMQESILVV